MLRRSAVIVLVLLTIRTMYHYSSAECRLAYQHIVILLATTIVASTIIVLLY